MDGWDGYSKRVDEWMDGWVGGWGDGQMHGRMRGVTVPENPAAPDASVPALFCAIQHGNLQGPIMTPQVMRRFVDMSTLTYQDVFSFVGSLEIPI